MERHGWEHRLMQLGKPWQGFGTKMTGFEEALAEIAAKEPKKLVVLTDSADVQAVKSPAEFMALWNTHFADKKMVIGAETYCAASLNCSPTTRYWAAQPGSEHVKHRHVNSGLMAGHASYLLHVWRDVMAHSAHDDQIGVTEFIERLDTFGDVALDHESRLFYNDNWGTRASYKDGVLHDPLTGPSSAAFYHFPGMSFTSQFALRKNYKTVGEASLATRYLEVEPGKFDGAIFWAIAGSIIGVLCILLIVFIVLFARARRRSFHVALSPTPAARSATAL